MYSPLYNNSFTPLDNHVKAVAAFYPCDKWRKRGDLERVSDLPKGTRLANDRIRIQPKSMCLHLSYHFPSTWATWTTPIGLKLVPFFFFFFSLKFPQWFWFICLVKSQSIRKWLKHARDRERKQTAKAISPVLQIWITVCEITHPCESSRRN